MARGKFFLGFFISSAAIAITSNPVYAKNKRTAAWANDPSI